MKPENTSKTARVIRPHRTQVEMQLLSLDQMLPADHRARVVWAFDSRVIVGVAVTNGGTDGGELPPMLDKVRGQYGKAPSRALVDSAYATQNGRAGIPNVVQISSFDRGVSKRRLPQPEPAAVPSARVGESQSGRPVARLGLQLPAFRQPG